MDQAGVLEQAKVRRDARLAEAGDLLEFIHGKLVPFEQRDDAQARRVAQRAEGAESGGHLKRFGYRSTVKVRSNCR